MCAQPNKNTGMKAFCVVQAQECVTHRESRRVALTPNRPARAGADREVVVHMKRVRELHASNMDDNHKTDSIYFPHSVAFGNGHSEAVAMNPWRRFSTRVLCNSPLQQATIVPFPCPFSGVAFVSLVPISVPNLIGEREKEKEKEQFRDDQKKLI